MIIVETELITEAFQLLTKIRNDKKAEFTAWTGSYSCVNSMDIDLHVPRYKEGELATIRISFQLGSDNVKKNKINIEKLRVYANDGFESEPEYVAAKKSKIDEKKAAIKQLQKELKETA